MEMTMKMKITTIALAALGFGVTSAVADVGATCTQAAENGDIELPDGMSVDDAVAVCSCIGENASGDIADEFMESMSIYDLDERMSSLSDEASAVFASCAG